MNCFQYDYRTYGTAKTFPSPCGDELFRARNDEIRMEEKVSVPLRG